MVALLPLATRLCFGGAFLPHTVKRSPSGRNSVAPRPAGPLRRAGGGHNAPGERGVIPGVDHLSYEVKRGAGLHDSGKRRSMLKDALCIQVLLKHYAKQRGYDSKSAESHFIFFYGKCSIPRPFAITGAEMDQHPAPCQLMNRLSPETKADTGEQGVQCRLGEMRFTEPKELPSSTVNIGPLKGSSV
jgi:hypothetical protein